MCLYLINISIGPISQWFILWSIYNREGDNLGFITIRGKVSSNHRCKGKGRISRDDEHE